MQYESIDVSCLNRVVKPFTRDSFESEHKCLAVKYIYYIPKDVQLKGFSEAYLSIHNRRIKLCIFTLKHGNAVQLRFAVLEHWYIDMLVHWYTDTRHAGTLVH